MLRLGLVFNVCCIIHRNGETENSNTTRKLLFEMSECGMNINAGCHARRNENMTPVYIMLTAVSEICAGRVPLLYFTVPVPNETSVKATVEAPHTIRYAHK